MDRYLLEGYIQQRLSTWGIARESGKSQTTVRYWLKKFGLSTKKKVRSETCLFCDREVTRRRRWCRTCSTVIRRVRLKIAAVRYLGEHCTSCGWKGKLSEYAAYEFHHRDPTEKDFAIGKAVDGSWGRMRGELDKCDLLCSRCHRIKHAVNYQDNIIEVALDYGGDSLDGLL